MKYLKLALTGLDISCIGFGTWQIGGGRWQPLPNEQAIQLLNSSLELGINIYDSAVVYGQYEDDNGYLQSRSQELLGKAFKNNREKVIYNVKVGQFDEYSHRHNYDPQRIVSQVRQSLRRLQTEYIDICLIHAPSIDVITNGNAISVLKTLQAMKIIKFIGYSFEAEPEHALEAIKQNIDVIMLQYNLLQPQCKSAIEAARKHGVGVLVGGPYQRGYLTGNYTSTDMLPECDDYWRYNLNKNPLKVQSTLDEVNRLLDQYKTPFDLRAAAIKLILSEEGVNSCIIGHRALEEIKENITHSQAAMAPHHKTILKKFPTNI